MDISYTDEEEEHVIHIGKGIGSFSTSISILEPNLDTPSTSTNQPKLDIPSTSTPQTINVSPPPTLLLDSIILKQVCENIF